MSQRFYYCTHGKTVQGPVTNDELRSMQVAGTLNDSTQICAEGTTAWQKITPLAGPKSIVSRRNTLLLVVGTGVLFILAFAGLFFNYTARSQIAKVQRHSDHVITFYTPNVFHRRQRLVAG